MSVYFARVRGYIKIGYSAKPWARVTTLTSGTLERPVDIEYGDDINLLGFYPGGRKEERAAHMALGQHWAGVGEWYWDDPEVEAHLLAHPERAHCWDSGLAFMAMCNGYSREVALAYAEQQSREFRETWNDSMGADSIFAIDADANRAMSQQWRELENAEREAYRAARRAA